MNALAREAHVWLAHVDAHSPRHRDWLDSDERTRCDRYLRDGDRDLFLVAHTHLRATLSRYADMAPQDWRFVRAGSGRPRLAAGQRPGGLRFNLSHTEGLVACVVTAGANCGVDVEREGHVGDRDAVARQVMHDDECVAVVARPQTFLSYWTLRESYLKATGEGLRASARDVRFELGLTPQVAFAHGPDTPEGWRFACSRPTDRHHLAVAVSPPRVVRIRWT